MASIQRKQNFSKEELKKAIEALDKIFLPNEMSAKEKQEYDQLIKSNQVLR